MARSSASRRSSFVKSSSGIRPPIRWHNSVSAGPCRRQSLDGGNQALHFRKGRSRRSSFKRRIIRLRLVGAMSAKAVPRVLVAEELSPEAVDHLRSSGVEVDVRPGLAGGALLEAVAACDGLVVRSATKVTSELLDAAPRLRVVGRAGVGVDNVDLAAATRRGVLVVNTPGGSAIAVAELALGMLLALSRHLVEATTSLRAGRWEKKRLQGKELAGKTLGIVGIGNVGSALASRARAMGMEVVAYDPFIGAETAARMGVRLLELDALWGEADVVSLHVPLDRKSTRLNS